MIDDIKKLTVGNRILPTASGGLWTRTEGVQTHQDLPMGMEESTGIDFLSWTQDPVTAISWPNFVSAFIPSTGQCCCTLSSTGHLLFETVTLLPKN